MFHIIPILNLARIRKHTEWLSPALHPYSFHLRYVNLIHSMEKIENRERQYPKGKCVTFIWETQVWSLGQEDPLEKGMATHSSILAWEIPWTEEPGELQPMVSQRIRHNWGTNTVGMKRGGFWIEGIDIHNTGVLRKEILPESEMKEVKIFLCISWDVFVVVIVVRRSRNPSQTKFKRKSIVLCRSYMEDWGWSQGLDLGIRTIIRTFYSPPPSLVSPVGFTFFYHWTFFT